MTGISVRELLDQCSPLGRPRSGDADPPRRAAPSRIDNLELPTADSGMSVQATGSVGPGRRHRRSGCRISPVPVRGRTWGHTFTLTILGGSTRADRRPGEVKHDGHHRRCGEAGEEAQPQRQDEQHPGALDRCLDP